MPQSGRLCRLRVSIHRHNCLQILSCQIQQLFSEEIEFFRQSYQMLAQYHPKLTYANIIAAAGRMHFSGKIGADPVLQLFFKQEKQIDVYKRQMWQRPAAFPLPQFLMLSITPATYPLKRPIK